MAHIAPSLSRPKPCLRQRRARSPQCVNNRKIEAPRQRVGLVEPAAQPPPGMQWHRHDAVGVLQEDRPIRAHEGSERGRQGSAAVVLECMNDRAQRPVVLARCSRAVERRRRPPAPRAGTFSLREGTPRGEWIATNRTDRRQHGGDVRPARAANRTAGRGFQHAAARRALWRQGDGQDGIERSDESGVKHRGD